MWNLGELHWFLGICVKWDQIQQKLWLCQDSYIEKIAKSFYFKYRKSLETPMYTEELQPSDRKASPQDIHIYQYKVGSALYTMTITWPDATCATNKLSKFL